MVFLFCLQKRNLRVHLPVPGKSGKSAEKAKKKLQEQVRMNIIIVFTISAVGSCFVQTKGAYYTTAHVTHVYI